MKDSVRGKGVDPKHRYFIIRDRSQVVLRYEFSALEPSMQEQLALRRGAEVIDKGTLEGDVMGQLRSLEEIVAVANPRSRPSGFFPPR
jgi:hypothetical protein